MAILIILIWGCGVNAYAADVSSNWEGIAEIDKRPVQILMALSNTDSSGRVTPKIEFGSPWNCSLVFQAGRLDNADSENGAYLGIDKTNGGKCDKFIDGFGMFKVIDSHNIDIELFSKSGKMQLNLSLREVN